MSSPIPRVHSHLSSGEVSTQPHNGDVMPTTPEASRHQLEVARHQDTAKKYATAQKVAVTIFAALGAAVIIAAALVGAKVLAPSLLLFAVLAGGMALSGTIGIGLMCKEYSHEGQAREEAQSAVQDLKPNYPELVQRVEKLSSQHSHTILLLFSDLPSSILNFLTHSGDQVICLWGDGLNRLSLTKEML